jgi:O-antigen/teichoic acid export membrane protein
MLAYIAPRIANVSLRFLAMGCKFALVIALARFLTPAEVGLYGLFAATVGFSVLMVGGDYYTYSQRELLSRRREDWAFVLQHQAIATLTLYLVLLPAQALIFWLDLMPVHLAAWFFLLLVVEHIAQEINRLLVAMQRPLLASLVLFIRMGLWVWFLLPWMWLKTSARTLESVFEAWFIGCTLALALGGVIIWREARPWKWNKLDTAWLKRGFGVALMFLMATVCFKALQTVDRYVVQNLAGADFLGVYVVYSAMAGGVLSVLDPAVFSFLYPPMVSAFRQGDHATYARLIRELAYSAVGLSVLVAGAIGLLAPYVFEWTSRPIYAEHLPVLWILLCMTVVYAAGMVPHYALYAQGGDKIIVLAHVSSLLVFGVVVAVLANLTPLAATAYALLAAFLWMGAVKYFCYRRLSRRQQKLDGASFKQEPVSV